jgi:membrane dipeptidase
MVNQSSGENLKPFIFFVLQTMLWSLGIVPDSYAQKEDEVLKHANEFLRSNILIDGHNDLPWVIREKSGPLGDIEAYDIRNRTPGDTDIPKMREGNVGAQFWSVYIPAEMENGFSRVQLEQIDLARRMIKHYSETFSLVLTASGIQEVFQQGKIASLLGMEGGHGLEDSLGALRAFYDLGVRYMTLTHSLTLDWADSTTDEAKNNDLTSFGKEVVREMNRLGMLVDLSHVTEKTMNDALDVSEAPIIFSHSSARGLTNHPRNVPDTILARIPENGGIVMVTFIPAFFLRR